MPLRPQERLHRQRLARIDLSQLLESLRKLNFLLDGLVLVESLEALNCWECLLILGMIAGVNSQLLLYLRHKHTGACSDRDTRGGVEAVMSRSPATDLAFLGALSSTSG